MITLTATVITGSDFAGWTGACTGSDLVCQVTMDAAKNDDRHVRPQYLSPDGDQGRQRQRRGYQHSSSASTAATTVGETYPYGTVVTLTAAAEAGSAFGGWTEACTGRDPCAVTMDAARHVTATFVLRTPIPFR